jgi:hypothetical protein
MPDLPSLAETAVLALVLLAPGLAVSYLLGLRGIAAWAIAPPVSITLVAVGGIVAPVIGLRWSLGALLLFLAPTALGSAAIGWLLRRDGRVRSPQPERSRTQIGAVVGVLAGGLSTAVAMALSIRSFAGVPAQPDTAYHLGQIRHMLQTGDISSLHAGGFLSNRPNGFYPAAFHGVATTGAQLVHVQPIVAANIVSILAGGLLWTSGCVLLARQAFGAHGATLAVAGLVSASFTAMPFLISGYGVLWPNVLGMAMVPALLGCLLSVVGLATDDAVGRPRGVLAILFVLPGLFFAHPNSVATLGLVGFVIVAGAALAWVVRRGRQQPVAATLAVLALLAPPLLWVAAQSIHRIAIVADVHTDSPPDETKLRALTEMVLNNPRFGAPLWMTSALVVVGFVVALRSATTRWIPAVHVVTWLVFVGVAAYQNNLTQLVTGFWYNTSPRLAAITVIPGFLLATLGLVWASHLVDRLVRRAAPAAYRRSSPVMVTAGVLAAYVVLSGGNNVLSQQGRLEPFYRPKDPNQALLSQTGAKALERLAPKITPGRLVATNPWRGTSLLYALTGRKVLFPTPTAAGLSPQHALVAEQLANAANRPDVCAAVRDLEVAYVITGGTNFMPNRAGLSNYPGVDQVAGAPGFVEVARSGPYTLWRVATCGG